MVSHFPAKTATFHGTCGNRVATSICFDTTSEITSAMIWRFDVCIVARSYGLVKVFVRPDTEV